MPAIGPAIHKWLLRILTVVISIVRLAVVCELFLQLSVRAKKVMASPVARG